MHELKYQCPVCTHKYASKASLDDHYERKHLKELAEKTKYISMGMFIYQLIEHFSNTSKGKNKKSKP